LAIPRSVQTIKETLIQTLLTAANNFCKEGELQKCFKLCYHFAKITAASSGSSHQSPSSLTMAARL